MKKLVWIALLVLLTLGIAFLARPNQKPPESTVKTPGTGRIQPPESPETPTEITVLPTAEIATTLNTPETNVQDDLSTLDLLISRFRKIHGGNPVGANDEITAALLGKNSKRIALLQTDPRLIDTSGQLIDRWGTPYFFHAISGEKMQIISAGPDLKHHTADDIFAE